MLASPFLMGMNDIKNGHRRAPTDAGFMVLL
jgi:hypothetical protein